MATSCILLVILFICCCLFWKRYRAKQQKEKEIQRQSGLFARQHNINRHESGKKSEKQEIVANNSCYSLALPSQSGHVIPVSSSDIGNININQINIENSSANTETKDHNYDYNNNNNNDDTRNINDKNSLNHCGELEYQQADQQIEKNTTVDDNNDIEKQGSLRHKRPPPPPPPRKNKNKNTNKNKNIQKGMKENKYLTQHIDFDIDNYNYFDPNYNSASMENHYGSHPRSRGGLLAGSISQLQFGSPNANFGEHEQYLQTSMQNDNDTTIITTFENDNNYSNNNNNHNNYNNNNIKSYYSNDDHINNIRPETGKSGSTMYRPGSPNIETKSQSKSKSKSKWHHKNKRYNSVGGSHAFTKKQKHHSHNAIGSGSVNEDAMYAIHNYNNGQNMIINTTNDSDAQSSNSNTGFEDIYGRDKKDLSIESVNIVTHEASSQESVGTAIKILAPVEFESRACEASKNAELVSNGNGAALSIVESDQIVVPGVVVVGIDDAELSKEWQPGQRKHTNSKTSQAQSGFNQMRLKSGSGATNSSSASGDFYEYANVQHMETDDILYDDVADGNGNGNENRDGDGNGNGNGNGVDGNDKEENENANKNRKNENGNGEGELDIDADGDDQDDMEDNIGGNINRENDIDVEYDQLTISYSHKRNQSEKTSLSMRFNNGMLVWKH